MPKNNLVSRHQEVGLGQTLEDCPTQLTLIFLFWYLYLSVCISLQIPKLQIGKKYREISAGTAHWAVPRSIRQCRGIHMCTWLHLLFFVVQIAMSICNQSALISIYNNLGRQQGNVGSYQGQGRGSDWWGNWTTICWWGSLMRTSVSSMTLLLASVYCWYP